MFEQKINLSVTLWSVEYTLLFTTEIFGDEICKRYKHKKGEHLDVKEYETLFKKEVAMWRKFAFEQSPYWKNI